MELTDKIFALDDALHNQDFLGRLYSLEPIADLMQDRFPRDRPYTEEEGSAFLILAEGYCKSSDDDDRSDLFDAMLEIID